MIQNYGVDKTCAYCGEMAQVDDVGYTSKGHQDIYLLCSCGGSAIIKIRHGNIKTEEWEEKDGKL